MARRQNPFPSLLAHGLINLLDISLTLYLFFKSNNWDKLYLYLLFQFNHFDKFNLYLFFKFNIYM